jgi:hypothetical protein
LLDVNDILGLSVVLDNLIASSNLERLFGGGFRVSGEVPLSGK